MRRSFDAGTSARFRTMPSETALTWVAIDLKADTSFFPVKDSSSRRWHARTPCGEFEILTTGSKWYDTRAKRGGGGAVDLVMHLCELPFVDAVKYLMQHAHGHG